MEFINWKKLNIKVRIISTRKIGKVVGRQSDFWGTDYFIIKLGRDIYPFKKEEFKYISSNKII